MLEVRSRQKAEAEQLARDVISPALERSKSPQQIIKELERQMLEAARNLEFEAAAVLRDKIMQLKGKAEESWNEQDSSAGKRRSGKKQRSVSNKRYRPK
jgi:excinuclease UvrABC helicase subunit UvrB